MSEKPVTNVLVVGVGGQGIIRLSNIIAEAAFQAGDDVKKSEIHGLSQRGGSVMSHIRWGEKVHTPVIMEGDADYILALEELEALRNVHMLKPGGRIVVSDFRLLPATVVSGSAKYPEDIDARLAEYGEVKRVDAAGIARGLGNIKASNIVVLGVFSKWLGIPEDTWVSILKDTFPEKFLELNLNAFAAGSSA